MEDGGSTPWRDHLFQWDYQDKYDFILVSKNSSLDSKEEGKRRLYLSALEQKRFKIKKVRDGNQIFYGVRAPPDIFQKYVRLLKNPDRDNDQNNEDNVSTTSRIRIVHFILYNTGSSQTEKLDHLITLGVFETAFPLHNLKEGVGCELQRKWINWRTCLCTQPVKQIRGYFGEKVALYFAWLGWYTVMLFPAALVGSAVFLYGFVHFSTSQISQEICTANNTVMCPLCDQNCPYWPLSDTCTYAKVTHLFDNEGTVFFAMFMALWATVFLELWKRQRAKDASWWHLFTWDEEEEELALELINDPEYQLEFYQHSYLRSTLILLGVASMIAILIGIAHALVIYRVVITVVFMRSEWKLLSERANTAAVLSGAVLHYITIVIMTKINRIVSTYLCNFEKPRTFTDRENSFTVKVFTFQFVTHFSSLFYVAFFLGRINGYPGNYVRIAGEWRLEECHPSGCITDLFIQMSVIMVLKQTLSNCVEFLSPYMKFKLRTMKDKKCRIHCEQGSESNIESWRYNYMLCNVHIFSLFDEFLEMVIQYSFTTIFVAAFPLAPLLAFINNLLEIRLDAMKMTKLQRRLVPRKANDIGIWLQVLEAVGVLAVITNGLVIAITSDFIPRLIYKYAYGPCTQENNGEIDCLTGYINHSLSTFRTSDFESLTQVSRSAYRNITECRYRDYRSSDDYSFSVQFWHIFAARLAFVIVFEHVAVCIKFVAAWFVPDIPQSVKNKSLQEKHIYLLEELGVIEHSTAV
ncbi:anoctamin-9 isoform X2 [Bombina bombina]|uniref:anoctamin-9 isoform X2 n=1 Tax=Bombina bombina TaxID=8345 RepID=UPI00235AC8DB|nr:anoctamin-9 isoform X2 [Bombina bombina]